MKRDGYKCVVTGYKDFTHPKLDESDPEMYLHASHILRRAIGSYKNEHTSDSVGHLSVQSIAYRLPDLFYFFRQFKSAVTTFDILRNFTRIPVEKLEDLHSELDDPSNGMMLQIDTHNSFDRFNWCLQKTEVGVPSIDTTYR